MAEGIAPNDQGAPRPPRQGHAGLLGSVELLAEREPQGSKRAPSTNAPRVEGADAHPEPRAIFWMSAGTRRSRSRSVSILCGLEFSWSTAPQFVAGLVGDGNEQKPECIGQVPMAREAVMIRAMPAAAGSKKGGWRLRSQAPRKTTSGHLCHSAKDLAAKGLLSARLLPTRDA